MVASPGVRYPYLDNSTNALFDRLSHATSDEVWEAVATLLVWLYQTINPANVNFSFFRLFVARGNHTGNIKSTGCSCRGKWIKTTAVARKKSYGNGTWSVWGTFIFHCLKMQRFASLRDSLTISVCVDYFPITCAHAIRFVVRSFEC